jgi:hypothetical protein
LQPEEFPKIQSVRLTDPKQKRHYFDADFGGWILAATKALFTTETRLHGGTAGKPRVAADERRCTLIMNEIGRQRSAISLQPEGVPAEG